MSGMIYDSEQRVSKTWFVALSGVTSFSYLALAAFLFVPEDASQAVQDAVSIPVLVFFLAHRFLSPILFISWSAASKELEPGVSRLLWLFLPMCLMTWLTQPAFYFKHIFKPWYDHRRVTT